MVSADDVNGQFVLVPFGLSKRALRTCMSRVLCLSDD